MSLSTLDRLRLTQVAADALKLGALDNPGSNQSLTTSPIETIGLKRSPYFGVYLRRLLYYSLFVVIALCYPSNSEAQESSAELIARLIDTVPGMQRLSPLKPIEIPTVPCPGTTMTDETAPPRTRLRTSILLPDAARGKISLYRAPGGITAIAPAGWTCRLFSGSSGWVFKITATGIGLRDENYSGHFVSVDSFEGGTSGRFQVAMVASQLFPDLASFAEQVRSEKFVEIPTSIFDNDTHYFLNQSVAVFASPPNAVGLGTLGEKRSLGRILGVASYRGTSEPNVRLIRVHLADSDAAVRAAVLIHHLSTLRVRRER